MPAVETPSLLPENGPAPEKKRDLSLRKVVSFFAASSFVTTILRLVGGVLTTRFIDPSILGQYNAIGLVQGYAPFFQLGIANGLTRDLPYYLGKGEKDRAEQLVAAAQWWTILISSITGVVLFVIGLYQAIVGRWDLAFGWWSYIVIVFFAIFGQLYLRALFRTGGDFIRLANINMMSGTFALLLVSVVWWLGWWGLCLRGLGVAILGLALMWCLRPIRVKPKMDFHALLALAKTGFPIFAVGQFMAWWSTLNATMVLTYAGKKGLGLYALANLAGPTVFLLPKALNSVIYPRMSSSFGKSGTVQSLVKMTIKPMMVTIATCFTAVIIGWFTMPFVVRHVLPKYIDGISAAQWALLSAGVMAFATVNNVFPVVKRQGRYGFAIGGGMLAYIGALQLMLRDGVDLVDFPIALLIGRSIFMLICYGLIAHLLICERRLGKLKVSE